MREVEIDADARAKHFLFMGASLGDLADAARRGLETAGRGAVAVGQGWEGPEEMCLLVYVPIEAMTEDPFVVRLCEKYEPELQMVVVFFGDGIRSAYTVFTQVPVRA